MHDKIKTIATTYQDAKDKILTEEATKNALIMPFIAALGYNVFNPLEVIPEFDAGVAGKKGEKVDYAIKYNDSVAMLIECKLCGSSLIDKSKISQLFHYFAACKARLALLTDGLKYHFFAATEEANIMDETPFFVFNILNFDEAQITELQRFVKSNFDLDSIICDAIKMKMIAKVGVLLGKYMVEPSENFIKSVLDDLGFQGMKTKPVIAAYGQTIKEAFAKFVKDKIDSVLRAALKKSEGDFDGIIVDPEPSPEPTPPPADDIVTTPEEIEAYAIIKGIGWEIVEPSRITIKDAKSYCSILLDNKNYKPIAKLYFNKAKKKLNLFAGPQDKKGELVHIGALDEIYKYADRIKAQIKALDAAPHTSAPDAETEHEAEPSQNQSDL